MASPGDPTAVVAAQEVQVPAPQLGGLPSQVDPLWALIPPDPPQIGDEAADALLLKAERRRYQTIVDLGGWTVLPTGSLRQDDKGGAVAALRSRLDSEGYAVSPQGEATVFDAGLTDAVRRFQRLHDLPQDGVVDAKTRRALDVPAEARLGQIDANLERRRWLPRDLPADRLEVDVAGAEATLFVGGAPVLTLRVIVGAINHKTPLFVSAIDAVVLNPSWTVPDSIARKEILPRLAHDPAYLRRHHFTRTPAGLRQQPGADNALGRVKFDLDSPFGVYLHDTPGQASFALPTRTLSHGCVRVERPRVLAAWLLAAQGWSPARIDRAIATGATRRLTLERPLPLVILYRTVAPDSQGRARFRTDPYDWDAKLLKALTGPPPA